MNAVIVYYEPTNRAEIISGIYNGVAEYRAPNGNLIALYKARTRIEKGNIKARNLLAYIPLKVSGLTYKDRKNDLEDKAIMWSYAGGVANWSYSELAEIQSFFETNGKRYGLIKEFHENGIC